MRLGESLMDYADFIEAKRRAAPDAILIEISPEYCAMVQIRIMADNPMFADARIG